jgi:TolB-like protein
MTTDIDRLTAALTDRYTLQRELGRGGMATVYLATDLKHDRPVALKVLKPELAAVLGADRFLREVKTTAQLTHPHILPLHDSGNADGFLYYVMPYVEGESLRDRLTREKQLPVDDALQISREVADALSYAHSHGVIHRDIKPENILLEAGHAVVADFGIARAIDQAGGERLTGTGIALGTPAYMSPEQAAGSKDLDGRSDLYALGCVLYEMLAGHPPFVGASVESLIQQHLTAEPPNITGIRPAVPAHVAATLERALAKTPADRFNPVALFAEALGPRASAAVTAVPVTPATPLPRRFSWERIALLGIAAVVVIAGAVAVGSWLRGGSTGPRHPRTAIAVLPFENLRGEGPNAYFAGGLHDELLTQLSKVAALKVIGRTSVLTYANSEKRLSEIGDELAVGSIVEGSVQVVGNRLRVSVQLIDPVTETHLWAEHYDRTLDDAFAVQSDIAQRIVGAVGGTLTGAEAVAIAAMPTGCTCKERSIGAGQGTSARTWKVRSSSSSGCSCSTRASRWPTRRCLLSTGRCIGSGMICIPRGPTCSDERRRQRCSSRRTCRRHIGQWGWCTTGANVTIRARWKNSRFRRISWRGLPSSGGTWATRTAGSVTGNKYWRCMRKLPPWIREMRACSWTSATPTGCSTATPRPWPRTAGLLC